jgi:hypothetical protein
MFPTGAKTCQQPFCHSSDNEVRLYGRAHSSELVEPGQITWLARCGFQRDTCFFAAFESAEAFSEGLIFSHLTLAYTTSLIYQAINRGKC